MTLVLPRLRFLPLLVVLVGCHAAQPQTGSLKLPSGKTVKVLGLVQMHFSQGPPALMLKYETELNASDVPTLRKEADEIWSVFQAEVEREQFQSAILSANQKPSGTFVKTTSGYNFVYQKRPDGQWHCMSDDKKN